MMMMMMSNLLIMCGRLCVFCCSFQPHVRTTHDTIVPMCVIHVYLTIIILTSLPKVIWEEGCVVAKVSSYWLQWCAPNSPPKVTLPVDRSPNPTTCLIPGPVRPMIQRHPDPIHRFSTMHWTDRRTYGRTDRRIVHGKV